MAVAAGTREGTRTGSFVLLGDERLARLAAAGHERAFTVVYQRYHQPLYRYCRSILRDDADAQDALQSTFAAAFVALARGQRDAPIRPWLFRIAHNESVSALRRRRPAAELSAASYAWTASTEDQVAERAELRMLLHDLRTLTERQRSALVMRELSGLSHEDIAIALGTSVGTAKQAIYEARRSMFEFAEGREMPCDETRRMISDTDGRALRGRRVGAHLRECSACAEFAAAIPARRAELRALAPALPTAAAAGLLEHVVGAGSGHAAGGGVAGLATAAAGKTASASLTVNALAGVAVVASATVGVTMGVGSLIHATDRGHPSRTVAPAVAPVAPMRALPTPGVRVTPETARSGHAGHAGRTARSSGSPTVLGGSRSAGGGGQTPSRATARAGGSTSTPTPGLSHPTGTAWGSPTNAAPGRSGTAPGLSTTSPGNSANAPGHSTTTSPGNSANAPGHSTTTSPGNSANAPGHSTTTSPGNSANAPGHLPAPGAVPIATTVPATPATTVGPPASTPGSAEASANGHSK